MRKRTLTGISASQLQEMLKQAQPQSRPQSSQPSEPSTQSQKPTSNPKSQEHSQSRTRSQEAKDDLDWSDDEDGSDLNWTPATTAAPSASFPAPQLPVMPQMKSTIPAKNLPQTANASVAQPQPPAKPKTTSDTAKNTTEKDIAERQRTRLAELRQANQQEEQEQKKKVDFERAISEEIHSWAENCILSPWLYKSLKSNSFPFPSFFFLFLPFSGFHLPCLQA